MNNKLADLIEYLQKNGFQKEVNEIFTLAKDIAPRADDAKLSIKTLASTADKLDAAGLIDEANIIDDFIKKYAKVLGDVIEPQKPKADNQNQGYDSKRNNEKTIREPKEKGKVEKDHHLEQHQETKSHSLSTRYCPLHVGVTLARVAEGTFQCPIDNEIYQYEIGYTDYEGNKVPGGSVAQQTPEATDYGTATRIFDSRESVINRVN